MLLQINMQKQLENLLEAEYKKGLTQITALPIIIPCINKECFKTL